MEENSSDGDIEHYDLEIVNNNNPIWICPNGRIIIECENPKYRNVIEIISKISKPIAQMEKIEEYFISEYTIYTAISGGISPNDILIQLQQYSKNRIPTKIQTFIEKIMNGRIVKVICEYDGKRYCECDNELKEEIKEFIEEINDKIYVNINIIEFKIECRKIDILVIEEVIIGKEIIPVSLRDENILRDYQMGALNSVFGDGFGRCGIIVLPCGAGKTLLSVALICTMQQNAIIICTSVASIEQWRDEIRKWSTIPLNKIKCFSSINREPLEGNYVVITTYQMMQSKGIEELTKRQYGLMILDEVHASVADEFKTVYSSINCRCRIGLTATLVREDSKLEELDFLTGPLLYQQSWTKLIQDGYLANVKCFDIICTMTIPFYEQYINDVNYRHKVLLSSLNPNKISATQFLVNYHKKRKEQIIIFCDSIVVLREIAYQVNCPVFSGEVANKDRGEILKNFKMGELMCVAMSSVGDTSLDIPDATVIIQVSTNHGSRRQQIQRLGRISRIKTNGNEGYFYTLTSKDTHEEYFVSKRQQYMQNMGFGFRVITDMKLKPMDETEQMKLIESSIKEADKRYYSHKKQSLLDEDSE